MSRVFSFYVRSERFYPAEELSLVLGEDAQVVVGVGHAGPVAEFLLDVQ